MNRYLYKHKDNASGQLNAGINASAVTIPLKAGQGALFPSTKTATATSAGSSVLLNCTGIGALGLAVGDIIENVTDGSIAIIKSIATDSIITTRLKGGSTNLWNNTNKWATGRFIITLINYDTDGVTVLKREKVLIDSRSTDTLTANASGRGFDGSTAQTFSADDYVYLFLTSPSMDGIDQVLSQIITDVDNLISQGSGEIYAADGGGTDAYAITLVPAPSAYSAGQVFNFKANTANVGAASLNVNGLGVKTIKKNHDLDLDDGDIEAGQVVTVVYDGTYFEMQSQIANVFASKVDVQKGIVSYAADAGATDDYAITLTPAATVYTTGMVIEFKANTANTAAATLNVNGLGAKTIKKNYNADLETGDIKANQIVSVVYDGTNFQMQSPSSAVIGAAPVILQSSRVYNAASGTISLAHGLGKTPKYVRVIGYAAKDQTDLPQSSIGFSDGTNNYCVGVDQGSVGGNPYPPYAGAFSSAAVAIHFVQFTGNTNVSTTQNATITLDATNVNLVWTKTDVGSPGYTNTIYIQVEVYS